ncbi:hypothetical protein ACFFTN_13560 [Aminobacter aganoensis]|uniref:Uncharacterized protein n=1 Tax=Aminobacter aganoensis TaxID=83264 RepID=A0A7X0FDE7_9HYPH|nr:hypothetical protein [Aminobacter aganoensis]MBB6357692.1 hypothetical protein [Aminobacter aganoensis]
MPQKQILTHLKCALDLSLFVKDPFLTYLIGMARSEAQRNVNRVKKADSTKKRQEREALPA